LNLCNDPKALDATAVDKFMDMFVVRMGDQSRV
jgi:hypothetical protein